MDNNSCVKISEEHFDNLIEILNSCCTTECNRCPFLNRSPRSCLLDIGYAHRNPSYAKTSANIFLHHGISERSKLRQSLLFDNLK